MQKSEIDEVLEANPNYILDFLESGSPIFQVKENYMFTSDAVELAKCVRVSDGERLVDFCSGSGIVGLSIAEKTGKKLTIDFVELQDELSKACEQTCRLSDLECSLNNYCMSVQEYASNEKNEASADVVVCNPPYFKVGSGFISSSDKVALARHELKLSLSELMDSARQTLKPEGRFYFLHLSEREPEIFEIAKKENFQLIFKKELDGKLKRTIFGFEKKVWE